MPEDLPILYSFRRCPYAMRARLAVRASGQVCALREIVLKDKAPEFRAASAKATVPVLVDGTGKVIEESLEIMLWALRQNDPQAWLRPNTGDRATMLALIGEADQGFKQNLDRYKYANRFVGADPVAARDRAAEFLYRLDALLVDHNWLFGGQKSLADMAIVPFVRQFANVDRTWFDSQPWSRLIFWLDQFLSSEEFAAVMMTYPKWQAGDPVTLFPADGPDAS